MITKRDFYKEFVFRTSLSQGAGGQHVNKVNTRVELRFSVYDSQLLSEEEKELILFNLRHYVVGNGIIQIFSQEERSQRRNKELCIKKFNELIAKALVRPKKRIPSKPSKAAKARRLRQKRLLSEKKANRNFKY